MKSILQKQKSAFKFMAITKSAKFKNANKDSILTSVESEKFVSNLKDDYQKILESVKVNNELPEVEDNVKKLWFGIQKLLKRNALLREMCYALQENYAQKKDPLEHDKTDVAKIEEEDFNAYKEIFEHEKERLMNEIEGLNTKLKTFEERSRQADTKINELESQLKELHVALDDQTSETNKERNLHLNLEEATREQKKEIEIKTCEISSLSNQLTNSKQQVHVLKNTINEQKLTNELLTQNSNHIKQKLLKVQEEYNSQTAVLEDITQKCASYMNQMKMYEDNAARMLAEVNKINKLKETWQKRIQNLENQKKDLISEKDKLLISLSNLSKELERERQLVSIEKKRYEEIFREKDAINKSHQRLSATNDEQMCKIKYETQIKDQLNIEINNLNTEMNKKNEIILSMEKEKEKMRNKITELESKLDEVNRIVNKRDAEILVLKKRLIEAEAQLHHQTSFIEIIKDERNLCNKNLLQTKDEILDLKNTVKILNEHIKKLKTEITETEDGVVKKQSVIQKLDREKEKLEAELYYNKEQTNDLKKTIAEFKSKEKALVADIAKLDTELQKKNKHIEQMMSEQEVAEARIVQKVEEIAQLNAKIKQLVSSKEICESENDQRTQEIKVLQNEIKNLRMEKAGLSRSLANVAHLRNELSHMEKELTKERVKSRALTEELQNPINIHRWRKLEGTDPDVYDLINKMHALQKKVLTQTEIVAEKQQQLEETEMMYDNLKNTVSKYSTPELVSKLHFMRKESEEKSRKIKNLLVEISMYESQMTSWKFDIEMKDKKLEELKKQLFANKKCVMKLKKRISEHVCNTSKDDKATLMVKERMLSLGSEFLSDMSQSALLPIIKISG